MGKKDKSAYFQDVSAEGMIGPMMAKVLDIKPIPVQIVEAVSAVASESNTIMTRADVLSNREAATGKTMELYESVELILTGKMPSATSRPKPPTPPHHRRKSAPKPPAPSK